MDRRRTWALVAGPAIVAAGVLPGFMIASLAPLIGRDFEFGAFELGLTVASFYLVCTLVSTPAGHLAQRVGADRAITYTVSIIAASCIGIALFGTSTWSLCLFLLLGGVGDALAGPACSLAFQRELPAERHGIAFGAQQAGAPLGALLAGLALPAIAIPLDWRWAFVFAALFAVAAGRTMPRAGGTSQPDQGRLERPQVDPEQVNAVRRLAVAAALASAAGVGLVSFIVLDAIANGIPKPQAGFLLAGISLLAGVARVAAGAVTDRSSRDPLRVAVAALALCSIGYAMLATGTLALIVAGALIGGIGWSWPGVLTLAVTQRAPHAAGWAVGLMMSGLFAGALVGPLAVGVLFGADLSEVAWLGCGIASLGAAGILAREQRLGQIPRLAREEARRSGA